MQVKQLLKAWFLKVSMPVISSSVFLQQMLQTFIWNPIGPVFLMWQVFLSLYCTYGIIRN